LAANTLSRDFSIYWTTGKLRDFLDFLPLRLLPFPHSDEPEMAGRMYFYKEVVHALASSILCPS
jgi:hypothetical protein